MITLFKKKSHNAFLFSYLKLSISSFPCWNSKTTNLTSRNWKGKKRMWLSVFKDLPILYMHAAPSIKRWSVFPPFWNWAGLMTCFHQSSARKMTLCQFWAKALKGLAASALTPLEPWAAMWGSQALLMEREATWRSISAQPTGSTKVPDVSGAILDPLALSPADTKWIRDKPFPLSFASTEDPQNDCFKWLFLGVICYIAVENLNRESKWNPFSVFSILHVWTWNASVHSLCLSKFYPSSEATQRFKYKRPAVSR